MRDTPVKRTIYQAHLYTTLAFTTAFTSTTTLTSTFTSTSSICSERDKVRHRYTKYNNTC